ncbi:hypothetical protein [Oleiphilus sp. HI0125]|uniref:hypothetical protein n=1 Tax=Oleiphilus sp. HI0125 TaxID=1822266 RepID=UPI0012E8D690|nr:hypothetical protein [Oleiphilus sp. HI0125]
MEAKINWRKPVMNEKQTNLRMNVLASFNVMPIICQLIGASVAASLGFGLDLDKTRSFSDLMTPVYASLAFMLLVRIARDFLKKHVTILVQYDTEVGLKAKEGKELQFQAYKLTLILQSLYIGLVMGWILVLMSVISQR